MIAFCLASSDHGTLIVNRLDRNECVGGFYGVGHQILENDAYEPAEIVHLKALLNARRDRVQRDILVMDCGANIGVYTVELARHIRGWGSVIAIEAQERIFYALAGNLAIQNCANARAIWAAVGSTEHGEVAIPEPDYWQPASFGSFEVKPRKNTEYIGQCIDYEEPTSRVKALAIDAMGLLHLDLIKLDIEGMEVDALAGAEQTIRRCKPDLFIEVTKSDRREIDMKLRDMHYDTVAEIGMNILAKSKE